MAEVTPQVVAEYPTTYTFRVVVLEGADVRHQVRSIMERIIGTPVPESAVVERPSAQGKYVSLHVTCTLQSEEQRREVYGQLQAQPFVKFML